MTHLFRTLLILSLCTFSLAATAQSRRDLRQEGPRELTAKQWRMFRKAYGNQSPWVFVETKAGETFNGILLHDDGANFHFWASTDFFEPRELESHYRVYSYREMLRMNDLFVYPDASANAFLVSGLVGGMVIGAPFGVGPITAGAGFIIGGGLYVFRQFLLLGTIPRLLFLMRGTGNSFFKDYRVPQRQLFMGVMPDTAELPYQTLPEWVEASQMMKKVFYTPSFSAYVGMSIIYMPQAGIETTTYLENTLGIVAKLSDLPINFVGTMSGTVLPLNPDPSEPSLSFLDFSTMLSYPFMEYDRFGVQRLHLAPEAGLIFRMVRLNFNSGTRQISQSNGIMGAAFGLRAAYRLMHRLSVWGRGQAHVVPAVEMPWATPQFDPNILRATRINTTSVGAQAGFSWFF